MTTAGWLQLAFLLGLLAFSTPLLGAYLAKVYGASDSGIRRAPGDRVFLPLERAVYRAGRIDPDREQRWTTYALSSAAAGAAVAVALIRGLVRRRSKTIGNFWVDLVCTTTRWPTSARSSSRNRPGPGTSSPNPAWATASRPARPAKNALRRTPPGVRCR